MAAARTEGMFDDFVQNKINEAKLLVVGAGGIGCELLKTLVLTGFEDLHVIDLDTIDLSNLNRQFLFHKHDIGRPKAIVARENVLRFNPRAKVVAYHDSITNPKYNVEFYRQFTLVANALDNVAARSHVNRMCMAAEIPLIESGSAGYLGQATVYKRKVTECFECLPRKPQKTYPGCTIRNTPSEPVHCIVWAKHLFNQLFGESDADNEVSPDVADLTNDQENKNSVQSHNKFSTREWAASTNYDPIKIFNKIFKQDILYLKQMDDLWVNRKAPLPLNFDDLPDAVPGSSQSKESEIQDFKQWSMKECGEKFVDSLNALHKRVQDDAPGTVLVWDKDDDTCLNFVTACSNLRSYCFDIERKSKFDVKAIAGNIIPAIAATNAIVAGLVVLQILKVLKGDFTQCRSSWINESYLSTKKLISSCQLEKPNPKCLVCSSSTIEVTVKLNSKCLNLKTLEEKILKEKLHMVQPDVVINDGTGTIVISSDPEDMTSDMYIKSLSDFNICNDSRLLCEDFLQNFKLNLVVIQDDELTNQDFIITSELDNVKPEEEPVPKNSVDGDKQDENDKDLDLLVEDEPEIQVTPYTPNEDENGVEPPTKKLKIGTD